MKAIDKMTLPELADAIWTMDIENWHVRDKLVPRLRAIHDLTRWIPLSERMPTEEDGAVRCTDKCDPSNEFVAKIIHGVLKRWTIGDFDNMGWYKVNPWEFTHWKRITPPEDK
jgi:hypothetical protein